MLIRTRLTLLFAGLMLGLLVLVSIGVYWFDRQGEEQLFYRRLQRKAEATAEVYVRKHGQLEETDKILLLTQEKQHEAVYDEANVLIYSSGQYDYYPVMAHFLNQIRIQKKVAFPAGTKQGVGMFFDKGTDRFIVIVTAEDTFGHERLANLKTNLALVDMLGLGLVIVLAWVFSGQSLQPAQQLLEEIQHLSLDNLQGRLPAANSGDEMGKLSHEFNQLLSRLDETVRQNRTFVTHASHELRTPLTNLLGTLQVSLSYDNRPDVLKATLHSAVEEVQELIGLANDLLLLAELGVENQARTLELTDQLLTEPLLDAVQTVNQTYPNRAIEVALPDEIDCCQRPIHVDLLTIALSNLLDNACKYSPPDTAVQATLTAIDDGFVYTVQDHGMGIPAEAIGQVFTPLYRAANARVTHKGNGVGLALVQRITQLHGGRVRVDSAIGEGTTVTLWVPKLPVAH